MPIIDLIERKSVKGRILLSWMYVTLLLGGAAMVYPFMVMLTGSTCTQFDYQRRSIIPRYIYSREDRLMRALCLFFPQSIRHSMRTMRMYFPDMPEDWVGWNVIGDKYEETDKWASKKLAELDDPVRREQINTAARDYRDFFSNWRKEYTVLAFDSRYVAPFLKSRYKTTSALNKAWNTSTDDFYKIQVPDWSGEPLDQSLYVPGAANPRYQDLLAFRGEYAKNTYTKFLSRKGVYAGLLRPAAMRYVWEDYAAKSIPGIDLDSLEFPVSAKSPAAVQKLWKTFLLNTLPMRCVQIKPDEQLREKWKRFLISRFHTIENLNSMLNESYTSWQSVHLDAVLPLSGISVVWIDFVRRNVPTEDWNLSSIPERWFQIEALNRYHSLEAINKAYGTNYSSLEQLRVPYGEAVLATFDSVEWPLTLNQAIGNYAVVMDYLFLRSRSVFNTIILVILALTISLTVNPLAGYALSRFRLKGSEKILLFCLATMAFPAAVTAIPGFLLLRDLGFLNTFWALALPGAANGMTIFLLKGFFDSLPTELFEAATVDGAPEHLIFRMIALPLVKPILAVGMLNAFLAAYNGWEWALVVCQDQKMWTIAVWTYQMYQVLPQQWVSMAGFVLTSLPVLVVFILCQNIIMRGIILPQMK